MRAPRVPTWWTMLGCSALARPASNVCRTSKSWEGRTGLTSSASTPGTALSDRPRSEEHTSELQSPCNLVCRLLLEKKKQNNPHDRVIGRRRTPFGLWLFALLVLIVTLVFANAFGGIIDVRAIGESLHS